MIENNTVLNTTVSPFVSDLANKYVIAFAILLTGIIIGRGIGRLVEFLLHKFKLNRSILKWTNRDLLIEETISTFISYTVYFIAVVMALEKINLIRNVLMWLSIGIIIILIFSFLLFIRDFVPNFFTGYLVRGRKLIKKGEHVKIGETEGIVLKIDLLDTILKTESEIIRIPNSKVFQSSITKFKRKKEDDKSKKQKDKTVKKAKTKEESAKSEAKQANSNKKK